jgi:hypothetical protein
MRVMRTIPKAIQALVAIPAHPAVHRLTGHPEPLSDLRYLHPGLDLQHSAIPLLRHGQLHRHSAECHVSSEATV